MTLLDEMEMHLTCRRNWLRDVLAKATQATEWGRPDFDRLQEAWDREHSAAASAFENDELPVATRTVFVMLQWSSPTAYPDGWTPRREAVRLAQQLAVDCAHKGRLLLGQGRMVA